MAYGVVNADKLSGSNGGSISPDSSVFRNRIINGAMVIDQRNAGAAVTSSGSFAVDRWFFNNATDGTLSVQQSTDVPSGSGFKYSLKMTATAGDGTIGASQYCNLQHRIEGFNFADTGFGASGASAVTLSFWVKATVAGNYSVALYNGAENRINPQQFSVLASNTWEQKTITYAGDTSGTWLTTNGVGANVTFYPALGSNFLGSAGWNAGGTFGVTGQSNAIASNANIFAITGVQLEKGSTATSFDYRPITTELALCQRYYWRNTGAAYSMHGSGTVFSTTQADIYTKFGTTMRAIPTVSVNATQVQVGATTYAVTAISGASGITVDNAFSRVTTGGTMITGSGAILTSANNTGGYIDASAEL